jgi:hypothetical protein
VRPFGPVDESVVRNVEVSLRRVFPPLYRKWLIDNNGAQPVGHQTIPGAFFALFEQRPLLGLHPRYPPYDLFWAEQRYRRLLTESHIVIGIPSGGLMTVCVDSTRIDTITFLPESAMAGQNDAETAAIRDQLAHPIAMSIYDLVDRLVPVGSINSPSSARPTVT